MYFCTISPVVSRPTVQLLVTELVTVSEDWYTLGIALGVPSHMLKDIKASNSNAGVMLWKTHMFEKWLDIKADASWKDVINALESVNHIVLVAILKQKYLVSAQNPLEGVSRPFNTSDF